MALQMDHALVPLPRLRLLLDKGDGAPYTSCHSPPAGGVPAQRGSP